MSVRIEVWAYALQRLTAMIMAPLVVVHLGVLIYAVQGGLSTAEMLGRTQSSILWPIFYGLFFIAAGVHATIGLRTIIKEVLGPRRAIVDGIAFVFLIAVLLLGVRAVGAIA